MSPENLSESSVEFVVKRDDWQKSEVLRNPLPQEIGSGEVLFRVDRFALTSNNITYAVIGEILGYWTFFPVAAPFGKIPAMGYADVIASRHPDVAEGERVFGFFPMATHLVIEAGEVSGGALVDMAAHRQATAPTYRQYLRAKGDALYEAGREDQIMLLRGLFITSFLVDDYLADNSNFGARTVVISSASSKTAIALAFLLSRRGDLRVLGLTSPRNVAFVEGLGCYGEVLTYDQIDGLPGSEPAAFVDLAGNGEVLAAVHGYFGDNLKYSGGVGATHWGSKRSRAVLPGPKPAFFFAPTQIGKRTAEWGAGGLLQRQAEAWREFLLFSDSWLEVVRAAGPEKVESVYREVLEGRARPEQGHVLSLWPDSATS